MENKKHENISEKNIFFNDEYFHRLYPIISIDNIKKCRSKAWFFSSESCMYAAQRKNKKSLQKMSILTSYMNGDHKLVHIVSKFQ